MKNIFKTLCLLMLTAVVFTACDNDDSASQPVIKYIRPTAAASSDSLLVSASMGQTIAIIGEGLGDVVSVVFNDQKAKLNPTYVTDNSIVVTVPGSIPELITNKMTLITSNNLVEYDFAVVIPSPSPSSISCEWAKDGDVATLYGNYFFARENGTINVLFPGNLEAEVVSFTDESIKVVVPNGALAGTITVTNDYGTGRASFKFRDDSGIFIDGENASSWNNWSLSNFATDGGIDGTYIKFEGKTGSWAWPANAIQLFYINPTAQPLVTDGEVADYALRFECYCHEWHDTPLLVWFSNESNTHNVDGTDGQYHWKPYNNNGTLSNYTTDGWVTITMPLSDFKYSKDESETSRTIPSLNKLQNLNMMWFGAVDASSTEFGLKMWIDNVRLVKIN